MSAAAYAAAVSQTIEPIRMKTHWHIEGYESTTRIFDTKVKIGYLSSKQVVELLRALAAKAGLSYAEIVGAYARKGSRLSNRLLEVRRTGPSLVFTCGENPHFIAKAVTIAEPARRVRKRGA